jgi:hypothetical protein
MRPRMPARRLPHRPRHQGAAPTGRSRVMGHAFPAASVVTTPIVGCPGKSARRPGNASVRRPCPRSVAGPAYKRVRPGKFATRTPVAAASTVASTIRGAGLTALAALERVLATTARDDKRAPVARSTRSAPATSASAAPSAAPASEHGRSPLERRRSSGRGERQPPGTPRTGKLQIPFQRHTSRARTRAQALGAGRGRDSCEAPDSSEEAPPGDR